MKPDFQDLFANFIVLSRYYHNDNLRTVAQDHSYISRKQLQQLASDYI